MAVLNHMRNLGYGEVFIRHNAASHLNAIIAIHSSLLGPALGGCRLAVYPDDDAALHDALRLAEGMTYKAALAGLDHGGGKAVIIEPRGAFDRHALFSAFGDMVHQLGGRYYTAEDSGTTPEDMHVIRSVTPYVTGATIGDGGSGDPSPFTALGVRCGIQACIKFVLHQDSLTGLHICVQGVGSVGYHLCRELHAMGARLTVADTDANKTARVAQEFGATIVSVSDIAQIECDVFAPCAFGGIINDISIPQLRCRIIAGAANNQLAMEHHGDVLAARGITYAPDYAINAGGLINVAQELKGYREEIARSRTLKIFDTIWNILEEAKHSNIAPHRVAARIARNRLTSVK